MHRKCSPPFYNNFCGVTKHSFLASRREPGQEATAQMSCSLFHVFPLFFFIFFSYHIALEEHCIASLATFMTRARRAFLWHGMHLWRSEQA